MPQSKKNQHSDLNSTFAILTDFQSNLSMFDLPDKIKKKFTKDFPDLNLKFVSDTDLYKYADNIIVYWGTKFKGDYFKKYKNLRWIHFGSVGVEKIEYKQIKNKKELFITNSKGINSSSMNELILLYLFDSSRHLIKNKTFFKSRKDYEFTFSASKDLNSSKILILGYGSVTRKLLPTLKTLNLKFDIMSNQKVTLKKINIYKYAKLEKIISNYDIIINNLPVNRVTKEIFDINIFKRLKNDSCIISCGRHGIFNLKSLYKFLYKNKDSFLYIDAPIFEQQIKSNELVKISKMKNVYLSPHIGGYFKTYWPKQYQIFSDNLKIFMKGQKLKNQVSFKKRNFL